MISIIFEKEDKKLAVQISKKFQSKGKKTLLNEFSENIDETENIDTAILIFSESSNVSENIIKSYNSAFDKQLVIVPFIISKIAFSVSMKHFLNTHDWINAYNSTTKEAIDDLMILLYELDNNSDDTNKIANTVSQKIKSTTKNKNQTYAILGVAAVFIVILGYLIFGNKNNNPLNNNQATSQELIVGSWRMADYQDNMQRSQEEYVEFIKNISTLKLNFLLKFSEDGSFEKYGFQNPERGNWQIDIQNMKLYMWPNNSQGQKDMLQIEKLTADTLIMSIATQKLLEQLLLKVYYKTVLIH
ncbi:MAG: hypothetical protein U9Q83_05515 [Bacteroidota bacterium]|nr:hypothetical protein [Bacteroidota bacterium]